MREYRVCHREHGSEHTSAVKFRDWGGRQNWQGNATDEEREQAALEWFDEHRRYSRIFYGIKECDMWLESREVSAWQEVCADGGTVSETYIQPTEEGPICPMPRASVIFEGQKLTFDEEDSARFAEIVKRHLRKFGWIEGWAMSVTKELPTWRKTCSMCGAYYAPYCYGIELMAGSDRELEHPYRTEPDDWCALWRRERKTEWNGRPCGRRIEQ